MAYPHHRGPDRTTVHMQQTGSQIEGDRGGEERDVVDEYRRCVQRPDQSVAYDLQFTVAGAVDKHHDGIRVDVLRLCGPPHAAKC